MFVYGLCVLLLNTRLVLGHSSSLVCRAHRLWFTAWFVGPRQDKHTNTYPESGQSLVRSLIRSMLVFGNAPTVTEESHQSCSFRPRQGDIVVVPVAVPVR